MKLTSFLNKNLIFLNFAFENYSDIINFISEKIADALSLDSNTVNEAFKKRENLGTTYIGHSLALPHGYMDSIDEIVVLFIRLDKERIIPCDRHPCRIRYIFAILTSTKKAQLYLKVLKSIAELVMYDAYILDNARTPEELIHSLDQKGLEVQEKLLAQDMICCKDRVYFDDRISRVVDVMKRNHLTFLPVVGDKDELLGVIDITDLFSSVFPQFNMDEAGLDLLRDIERNVLLDPIKQFWEHEDKKTAGEVMRKSETYTVNENASYIEIVHLMIRYHHRYLVVTDKENRMKGLIDTGDVIHKIIRA